MITQIKSKITQIKLSFLIVTFLVSITSLVFAHTSTSPNYTLSHPNIVVSSGQAASFNYSLNHVKIGEIFSGKAKSANYSLDAAKMEEEAAELSVSVTPDVWDIGGAEVNSIITMDEAERITVTNTGSSHATYSLCLVNPGGWTASQTEIDQDEYILNAAFSAQPGNIVWKEANHALSTAPVSSTSSKFAAEQTGVNVAPGEARTLWLQFKAPSLTAIIDEQLIEVIINAEVP